MVARKSGMASEGQPVADETINPAPVPEQPEGAPAPAPEPAAAPSAKRPTQRPLPKTQGPKIQFPKIQFPEIRLPSVHFSWRWSWDWLETLWRGLPHAWVGLAALIVLLICAGPSLAVIGFALLGPPSYLDALSLRLLSESVAGTLALVAIGGASATILGTLAALFVTLCRFPGRDVFEWLLALPLAAPVYVLAYSYSSLTWAGGPIPVPLTGMTGTAFVYAIGFFPYVYLSARASFASQSASALEAARSLGASPLRALIRIALPLARPGIAAGAALVCMEIAADYGAAQHFGAATITTGIFRAWFSHSAPQLALQLGAILVGGAFLFLWLERGARGRKSYAVKDSTRAAPSYELPAPLALFAILFCAALTLLGAIVPLAWLTRLMLFRPFTDFADLGGPLLNSLLLAACGAAATLVVASIVAAIGRNGRLFGRAASLAAGAGYAAPGAVLALGVLSLYGFAGRMGWVAGLGTALALALLVWTYVARFTATGAQPIGAGFARVTKSVTGAARIMGAGGARRLIQIDLPLAAPSVLAAALIVFIEILKELPATLLLRPFNFDTLAVRAYAYASDERLAQSAAPALMLTIAGLIPILFLSHQMTRAWTHNNDRN